MRRVSWGGAGKEFQSWVQAAEEEGEVWRGVERGEVGAGGSGRRRREGGVLMSSKIRPRHNRGTGGGGGVGRVFQSWAKAAKGTAPVVE